MNKTDKLPYEAPQAEPFVFKQSLDVLVGFSFDGDIYYPEFEDNWGKEQDQIWGGSREM